MPAITLDKAYTEAAAGMMPSVKNAVRSERVTAIADIEFAEIVIEGDFEVFSLSYMDMWGGHLRFIFRDTEAKTIEDIKWRGEAAMYNPFIASLMTAKAQLFIERQQHVTIRTIKLVNGREISREDVEQDEWTDVTQEFGRMAMRELAR